MNTEKILLCIGIIGLLICAFCICTIFILVKFNFIKFDENEYQKYNKNKIVESAEKPEKPYKFTDKDIDAMYEAGEGDKVTINGNVYIKHYCSDLLGDHTLWVDVTNLRLVSEYSLTDE